MQQGDRKSPHSKDSEKGSENVSDWKSERQNTNNNKNANNTSFRGRGRGRGRGKVFQPHRKERVSNDTIISISTQDNPEKLIQTSLGKRKVIETKAEQIENDEKYAQQIGESDGQNIPPRIHHNGPKGPIGGGHLVPTSKDDQNVPKIPPQSVVKAHHHDLHDWAKDYAIWIPQNTDLIKYFDNWQWKYIVKAFQNQNVYHPFSHFCRTKAVLAVIASAGRQRDTLTICDLYGSQRNWSMTPDKKKDPNLDIKWVSYGPNVIEGDTARNFTRNRVMPHTADIVLIQDVYQDGLNQITPEYVLRLAMQTNMQSVYVICRLFIGCAGADDFEDEGAWVRDPVTQRISFSPDQRQTPYAPHHDVNWLTSRGNAGLDIAHMASIGPYEIFHCSPTQINAISLYPEFMSMPAKVEMRRIPIPDFSTYCEKIWFDVKISLGSWFMEEAHNPYRDLMVHIPTYEKLVSHFASKPTHGLLMDGCTSQVANEFKESIEMPVLKQRFMQVYNRILFDTSLYVMYAMRQQASENMSILQRTFSSVNENLFSARSREHKPTGTALPSLSTFIAIGLAIFGIKKLITQIFRLWKGKTMGGLASIGGAWLSERITTTQKKVAELQTQGLMKLSQYYQSDQWCRRFYNWSSFFLPRIYAETFALIPTVPVMAVTPHIPLAMNPIYAVCIAPIQEELCRGTLLNYFTGLESLQHIVSFLLSKRYGHLVPVAMHTIFTYCPLSILFRIWFHATWNIWATAYIVRFGMDNAFLTQNSSIFGKLILEWREAAGVILPSIEKAIAPFGRPRDKLAATWSTFSLTCTAIIGIIVAIVRWYRPPPKHYFPEEERKEIWNNFLEKRTDCLDIEHSPGILPLNEAQIVPATIAKFRDDYTFRPDLKLKIQFYGNVVQLKDVISMLTLVGDESYTPVYIYPILITSALMYRPQPCISNDVIALCERTWNDPFLDLPGYRNITEEERRFLTKHRHKRWKHLAADFNRNFFDHFQPLDCQTTVEQAAKLMGSKGKRIMTFHDKSINEGDIPDVTNRRADFHYKKSVNLKHDEVIVAKTYPGFKSIKPRAIINFDPQLLCKMVAISRDISDYLHIVFQFSNVYTIAGRTVRFVYASGYTAEQLTELGNLISETWKDIVIMVAGDDSYMYNPHLKDGFLFIEADQSKYDHTQDEGPCTLFDVRWMRFIGVPEIFINLHVDHLSKEYKVKKKFDKVFAWTIGFSAGTQLASGTTETTYLNSIHCIAMYVYYLINFDKQKDLPTSAADLGFTVKQQKHSSFSKGTFLKGWWMPTYEGRLQWLPLPSALLKLGKLLVRPTDIAVGYDRRIYLTAVKQCAYALSRSPGLIPANYPLLGSFIQKMLSLSEKSKVQLPSRFKNIVIKELCEIDTWVVMEFVCDRYGITKREIMEAEEIINGVESLPAMIIHPIFEKMRDCDYG